MPGLVDSRANSAVGRPSQENQKPVIVVEMIGSAAVLAPEVRSQGEMPGEGRFCMMIPFFKTLQEQLPFVI